MLRKICEVCKKLRNLHEFRMDGRRADGLSLRCEGCIQSFGVRGEASTEGLLRCTQCKLWKDPRDFYKNRSSKSGRQSCCIPCRKKPSNKEAQKNSQKKWYSNNREKALQSSSAYREANRFRERVRAKEYRKNNPEKVRKWNQVRRARKKLLNHEEFTDLEIFERDNWVCQICKNPVNKDLLWPDPMSKSLDHKIPVSSQGPGNPGHVRKNVQLAHLRCNSSKGDKIMEDS